MSQISLIEIMSGNEKHLPVGGIRFCHLKGGRMNGIRGIYTFPNISYI